MEDETLGAVEIFEVQTSKSEIDSAVPVKKITINKASSGAFVQHPVMMTMKVKNRPGDNPNRTFYVKAELPAIAFSDSYEDQTISNESTTCDSLQLLIMLEGVRDLNITNHVFLLTITENGNTIRQAEIPVEFMD